MKVYLNKEYKCVKVEDNTFVANDSSNYIRYYFVTNANGDVIDKMDDTSVIYRNTEPSYVTVAFRRADGDVIQHLMASPKTDATGKSFFEYEITNTDGVLYKKGALEISAQFIEATLSEADGVKKVISQKVKAIAINTAHVLDNIGEEAEEYYSQYEQANNDAHAVLQTQITTNFNNIGTLQDLTTDAKDDLVKAINEVDAHADANKSEIGDLSTLTTDEKTTIVGAINEVDQHANTAQQTADTATELANTGISKAEQAQATANNAVATANEAKTTAQTAETNANSAVDTANAANTTANEAKAIAQGSQRAIGFATLQAAITALNGYSNTQLKVGDNVYIVETGVPDLWVAAVEQNSVAYNYTTNDAFNDDLVENTLVQVGYYKFAYLESDGKPCTVAWQNMTVAESDWVASTEFEDFAYEAKIILTDFVNFSSIPQVVFGLTEATSGNYAPICKAGDKGVYIYSKVNTAITLPTVVTFAPNVHGASMQGGGYTNKGKWVASTTYAIDDLVYTDNGQYVCIEGITSTTSPEQDTQHWQATFVATGKTKNGLKISGQNTDGSAVQKTFDGSTAVEIAFDENTMTAKEVNGVLEIGAKGTVPEALPQEASAVKSGNLPTTGWGQVAMPFWEGELSVGTSLTEVAPAGTVPEALRQDTNISNWSVKQAAEGWVMPYDIPSIEGANLKIPYSGVQNMYVYPDGSIYAQSVGSTYKYYGIKNKIYGKQTCTISDTSITANSDVLMELTDEGGVKSYSMEAGKMTVIRDTVPTQPIPYTYKVKQTNASGQFTLVNHFVPSIPESPTSLPVTYKKASGELPTSGWTATVDVLISGEISIPDHTVKYWGTISTYFASKTEGFVCNIKQNGSTVSTNTFQYVQAESTAEYNVFQNTDFHYSGAQFRIYKNGDVYVGNPSTSWNWSFSNLRNTVYTQYTFAISDTSITANTSVKIYLTDKGGVKAQSKAAGSIQVIRDSVPTTAIPYEYEVEQTSAEGLFEVINAYVPSIPESPTSLPVTYKKASGSLPTSGWGYSGEDTLWEGEYNIPANTSGGHTILPAGSLDFDGLKENTETSDWLVLGSTLSTYSNPNKVYISDDGGIYLYFFSGARTPLFRITPDGSLECNSGGYSAQSFSGLKTTKGVLIYSISDNAVTINSSVKMYLTDEKIKPYNKVDGSIIVTRNVVPTQPIPYKYEVEQTSTEGLFEIINDYVPVTSVNGQTGAVTIAVPTKTSQLTNDSGFITAADIPSAGEWSDIVESATLTEDGLYEFDAVKDNKHYTSLIEIATGISAVGASAYSPVRLSAKKLTSDTVLFQNTAGTITVTHINTEIDLEAASITETRTNISFKYRKIN